MYKAALLVPVLLLAQAGLVHWVAGAERPPPAPDLTTFPSVVPQWKLLRDDPVAPEKIAQLQADRLMNRIYIRTSDAVPANLFVAWFQTQSQGTRQPHSPQVCLPGSGWTPVISDEVVMESEGGPVKINRYVASVGADQAVVLYWYQTPRRTVASEWASKLWTVWDAVSTRRTDIALVRVVTWPKAKGDFAQATRDGVQFAEKMYPLLQVAFGK